MVNNNFENRTIYEIMWKKYCKAGQPTNHNISHAGYPKLQKRSEYVTRFCLSAATMVARKGLNVMLLVHCLSCLV
jgi:hypothetical protein